MSKLLFFAYSHKDESLRDELAVHLATLEHEGLMDAWYDRRIAAGEDWAATIEKYIEEAAVILLLVSADFLASPYCRDVELRRALERHQDRTARVVPIILRPCLWDRAPFAHLQALPADGKPITTWSNRDEAWLDVARSIRDALRLFSPGRQSPPANTNRVDYQRSIVAAPPPSIDAWVASSHSRFTELVSGGLQSEVPNRYSAGHFSFAYVLNDVPSHSLHELRAAIERAQGHETGWPPWMVFTNNHALAPYPYGGTVECWVHEDGDQRDGSYSDYWRASPPAMLFLLRGLQEDSLPDPFTPGTCIDRHVHIWRTGECLLHAQRLAVALGSPSSQLIVQATWSGLRGRRLGHVLGSQPSDADSRPSRQNAVTSQVAAGADEVEATLPHLVHQLIEPLYTVFDFERLDTEFVTSELERMRTWRQRKFTTRILPP